MEELHKTQDWSTFPRKTVEERVRFLVEVGRIDESDAQVLLSQGGALGFRQADQMIENVIGVLELPVGLGINFLVNGEERVVPMAVEEPSIVAAASHVARIVRDSGGYEASMSEPVMIAQLQVLGSPNAEEARHELLRRSGELLAVANALQPNLVKRGGGARDIEVRLLEDDRPDLSDRYKVQLVVHLLVDCRDAMGANLLNTMAEGLAPLIEEITGGRVLLRILSNLADRRLATARVRIPAELLAFKGYDGDTVIANVVEAARLAEIDPYRAATHNKGIMNAVDAVCLATGNDWRAQEAGAHAFAARQGRYASLTSWRRENDCLVGEILLPVQVGTVGAQIQGHPVIRIMHKVLGVKNAADLGQIMACAGLGQNLAALKALATEGIQAGHMSRHARAVAFSAGVPAEMVEEVSRLLIESGEIKIWKAQEIYAGMSEQEKV